MNVLEILAALSPIILSVVVTYIIVKQYQLDKQKFKQKFFDKRYDIYKTVMRYLSEMLANANTTSEELFEFKRKTSDIKIFFDDDINNYISGIFDKAVKLRHYNVMLKSAKLSNDEHLKLVNQENELLNWLFEQFSVCEDMFIKYLKIEVK